jgi:hypothetical protein
MAKYMTVFGNELQAYRRRPRSPWVFLLVIALVACPLLYEGGLIVVGKWQAMLGTFIEVKTPLLDRIGDAWKTVWGEIRYQAPSFLRFKGLPPQVVVGAIAAFSLFGSLFLRRGD